MSYDRVAITGGSGLLGAHVVRRLSGKAALTNVDLKPPHDSDAARARFINGSITDYAAMVNAFRGQDAVIHLAAIPNPRERPPAETFNNNVQGAWTVLSAAEEAGVKRIVVASSDSVFGLSYNPPDFPPQFLPVDETHPTRPTEFYSLSKKLTETICESTAARRKMEVMAIRPVHVVFPRGYPEIEMRGTDVQNYHYWSWVAPEDVAQAFDLALYAKDYRGFDAFVIAAAEGMNTRPTLDMARERWGTLPEVRRPELYQRLPNASISDITKARERLGYDPQVGLAQLKARAKAGA